MKRKNKVIPMKHESNHTVCEVGTFIMRDGETRMDVLRFPFGKTFDARPFMNGFYSNRR